MQRSVANAQRSADAGAIGRLRGQAGRFLLLAVVFWLAGLPVLLVVLGAMRGGLRGGWTDRWLRAAFISGNYLRPLLSTVELGLWVAALATALGALLAWMMSRLRPPGAAALEVGIMMPVFLSPFIGAIGWITLAQARSGLLNSALRWLGLPEIDVFTYAGAVIVMGVFFVPYAYALLRHAMDRLNPELEEAAAIAGAGPAATLRHVVLPLLWPSLLSALIITFVLAAEMFSIPGLLLVPQGYDVLSYAVYVRTTRWPINHAEASAIGLILLLLTVVGMALYARSVRVQERFITVGPRGARSTAPAGRAARLLALGVVVAFIVATVVLPVAAILLRSLLPYFSGDFALSDLTLANLRTTLADRTFGTALVHSLIVTGISTVLLLAIAFLVALGRTRQRGGIATATWVLASMPIAVPGVLFGVGLIWLYIGTPIYGSLAIIVLVMLARFLPILVRMFETGLMQLGRELEEAASVCGAAPNTVTWRIRIPLLAATFRSATTIVVTQVFNELTASALLFTSASSVLPVVIFNYMFDGDYARAAAIALLQIAVLGAGLALIGSAMRLFRRRGTASAPAPVATGIAP